MDFNSFSHSLLDDFPPQYISAYLQALWYDAKGDWEKAHEIAQNIETTDGSLIHAYLHRKEGDLSNAGYWYIKAKSSLPDTPIETEWEELVRKFL